MPQNANGICLAEASVVGDGNTSGVIERKPLRVFYVDDDEDACDLVERIFSSDGFECRSANCAADAMAMLATYVPDVIISDLSMPDEDGFSFIRRVRQTSTCTSVPAIALTAMDGMHHRRAALEDGFDLYIVKPAHPAALIEAVTRLALASRTEQVAI